MTNKPPFNGERMRLNYIKEDIPLWSVTTWDKRFTGVNKEWQPKTIKYKYLLSSALDDINIGGDVKLLYTGQSDGYTSEELAGDALSEGEIVSIPWGGTPSVKYYKGKFVTGDNRIATSNIPNKLLNKYIYYLLKGRMSELSSYYRGAGLQHPSMKSVLNMRISYPSVSQQKTVIAQFEALEELTNLLKLQIKKLDQLVKSRFVEMFGDPTDDVVWPCKRLDEICTVVTGNTPSRKDSSNYGDYIEWCKTDNITDAKYLTAASEMLSEQGASKGRVAPAGSILMACIAGSVKSIGKVAVVDRKVAFNQQINALIPSKKIDVEYLLWALKLSKEYLCSGVNMQLKGILNKTSLSAKRFCAPPLPLQQEFADFVAQVDKSQFVAYRHVLLQCKEILMVSELRAL